MANMAGSQMADRATRDQMSGSEALIVRLYLSAAIFLMTLQSFHIGGAAFVCYVGLVLLVPLVKSHPEPRTFVTAVALTFGVGLLGITSPPEDSKSLFGQLFSILALLIIPSVFYTRPATGLWALNAGIFLHAAAVAVQVSYFALTREYLDFLSMAGGAEQVVMSKKGLEISDFRVPRFAGLSNEPGTHATLMSAMLAVSYCGTRRWSWLHSLGAASVLATLSLGGMVVMLPLVVIAVFDRVIVQRRNIAVTILLASLVLSALAQWLLTNYEQRLELTNGASDHELMLTWLSTSDVFTLFGNDQSHFPYFFSLGYLGAGLDIFLLNGFWGASALFLFVASMGPVHAALCCIVFLSKIKITYPLFYALIGLLVVFRSSRAH